MDTIQKCEKCGRDVESNAQFCCFCGEALNNKNSCATAEQSAHTDYKSNDTASNPESKISNELISLSKVVKLCIIFIAVICTLIIWVAAGSSDILRIISVGVLIVLILVAHIISAVLYGFGELIHTNNEILSELRKRK